jgi:hypothetical protein
MSIGGATRSRIAEFARESVRAVRMAGRIPIGAVLQSSRYYYQFWPSWTLTSSQGVTAATPENKAAYRKTCVTGGHANGQVQQLFARTVISVFSLGVVAFASGWIWLSISASSNGLLFSGIALGLSIINILLLLPVALTPTAVYANRPWRGFSQFGIAWAIVAGCLLGLDGWPTFSSWFHHAPSLLHIVGYAASLTAATSVFAALLARVEFVIFYAIGRRFEKEYSSVIALLWAVELVDWIGDDGELGGADSVGWICNALESISRCLGTGMPAVFSMPPGNARNVATLRLSEAASAVSGYQSWVALPKPDSGFRLRERLAELAMTLLTGHYDLLPTSAEGTDLESTDKKRLSHWLFGIIVAVFPLPTIFLWNEYGPEIPTYMSQWLSAFAIVWFIARILQLLDPAFGVTWDRVHSALGSPRPPISKD